MKISLVLLLCSLACASESHPGGCLKVDKHKCDVFKSSHGYESESSYSDDKTGYYRKRCNQKFYYAGKHDTCKSYLSPGYGDYAESGHYGKVVKCQDEHCKFCVYKGYSKCHKQYVDLEKQLCQYGVECTDETAGKVCGDRRYGYKRYTCTCKTTECSRTITVCHEKYYHGSSYHKYYKYSADDIIIKYPCGCICTHRKYDGR